jgi:hypothetical protein
MMYVYILYLSVGFTKKDVRLSSYTTAMNCKYSLQFGFCDARLLLGLAVLAGCACVAA